MPLTPRGYRYPDGTQAPAVPLSMQQLAEDVDADMTNVILAQAQALDARTLTSLASIVGNTTTSAADSTERLINSVSPVASLAATIVAVAGITYKITLHTRARSTVAGDRISLKIRRTNLAGTVVQDGMYMPATAGVAGSATIIGYDVPGAGSITYVATFARSGGTGNVTVDASSTAPTWLEVTRV